MIKTKCICKSRAKTGGQRPCKDFALKYSTACLTHSRIKAIIIQSACRAYFARCKVKLLKNKNEEIHAINQRLEYLIELQKQDKARLAQMQLALAMRRCIGMDNGAGIGPP